MRVPKIIYKANFCTLSESSYTEYKYHGKVYDGCYEYINWWLNGSGKWRCFKIYLEVGNNLYIDWLNYLKGKKTNNLYQEF